MPRNIEIKARASAFDEQARRAAGLADQPPQRLEQTDTFFHAVHGRLKLREFGDGTAELIQYARADASGPTPSSWVRAATHEPQALKQALTAALGERAVVRKRRRVFLAGQTRIHLDEVEGLGRFIELEVVLADTNTLAAGQATAERLMTDLGIRQADLVSGAYVDLLGACRAYEEPAATPPARSIFPPLLGR